MQTTPGDGVRGKIRPLGRDVPPVPSPTLPGRMSGGRKTTPHPES